MKDMNTNNSLLKRFFTGLLAPVKEGVARIYSKTGKMLIASALSCSILFGGVSLGLLEKKPYTKVFSQAQEKVFVKGQKIDVLSWNVCFLPLATAKWEAEIKPWTERIELVSQKLNKENADLVCLQEVYDAKAAEKLAELLKDKYPHIYYNIGPSSVGVGSGLFVASKYPLKNIHFTPHKVKKNDIDSFFVNKGYFDFELYAGKAKAMHIFVVHLQHSKDDLNPLAIEKQIREKQIQAILEEAKTEKVPVLLVGDLNMPSSEYKALKAQSEFQNFLLKSSDAKHLPKTFSMMAKDLKKVDLMLDYALLDANEKPGFIFTKVLPNDMSLSDHNALKSTVYLSF